MGDLKLGDKPIRNVMLGDKQVKEIRHGDKVVWKNILPPPIMTLGYVGGNEDLYTLMCTWSWEAVTPPGDTARVIMTSPYETITDYPSIAEGDGTGYQVTYDRKLDDYDVVYAITYGNYVDSTFTPTSETSSESITILGNNKYDHSFSDGLDGWSITGSAVYDAGAGAVIFSGAEPSMSKVLGFSSDEIVFKMDWFVHTDNAGEYNNFELLKDGSIIGTELATAPPINTPTTTTFDPNSADGLDHTYKIQTDNVTENPIYHVTRIYTELN